MKNKVYAHLSYYLAFSTLLIIVMLTLSCGTEPDYATLSGTIMLTNDTGNPANEPVDNAGITIEMYASAVLDTAIVRANQNYPNVGVLITQETEFEYRNAIPLYNGVTNAVGEFEIKHISPGRYNIRIFKTNWGSRCLYDCEISSGDNTLGKNLPGRVDQTIQLFPEKIIAEFDTISILQEDHSYSVLTDVVLNHNLTMENGATLLIVQNSNLTIIGDLTTSGTGTAKYSRITVQGDNADYGTCFGRVMVYGDADVSHMVISNSLTGMQFQNGSVSASDIRLRNGPAGFVLRNNPSVNVSHFTVSDIGELITSGISFYATDGGIDLTGCSSGLVERSVLVRCNAGVRIREFSEITMSNCYFANNSIGLEANNNNSTFEHSHFEGNYTYDARVYGTCSPTLVRNNFNSSRGLNIGLNLGTAWLNCNPVISYNNFRCKYGRVSNVLWDFAIRLCFNNMLDIAAAHNYFYTTDTEIIDLLILDQYDFNPNDGSNFVNANTAYILYQPYLSNRVNDAGIQA